MQAGLCPLRPVALGQAQDFVRAGRSSLVEFLGRFSQVGKSWDAQRWSWPPPDSQVLSGPGHPGSTDSSPEYHPRGKSLRGTEPRDLGEVDSPGRRKRARKKRRHESLREGRGKAEHVATRQLLSESTAELFGVTNTMTDGDQKWKRRLRKFPRKQSKNTNIWKIEKEGRIGMKLHSNSRHP